MSVTERVVVVTGAAGGLGRAIVQRFLDDRALVVATDVDSDAGARAVATWGDRARYLDLDVSDETQWARQLDGVVREHGRLDVLVNNAGVFEPNVAFEDMPIELWRSHFAINSDGVFLGCKHALRHMKALGGGAIVNVASGLGVRARATASAYCASKAAVLMTTLTAAASGGPYGIRVNAVLPGAVPTSMLRKNVLPGQNEDEYFARLQSFAALGRLASPEEVASAIAFLADARNGTLSGVWLPVDGGNL